jgi:propionyl-CoA synthetase
MAREYKKAYEESIHHPEAFWEKAANGIHWYKPFERILDGSNKPFYRWFQGGELNTCYNAVDYHVDRGKGDQRAIVYDSPVTGEIRSLTYRELLHSVARFAEVLSTYGVKKGDRVIIYMPTIPETALAMLGCARIGAIHSVVFGGFAPKELAVRIDDARPILLISASCGFEGEKMIEYKPLLDKALEIANHKLERCIIYQRKHAQAKLIKGRDIDWKEAVSKVSMRDCVPVASTDPLYILYTSGTTGAPKGIVRDNGGHAVALKWSMKYVYGVEPGDVYWAASDVGWVVGHSYMIYGPLLHGCTTVMYEGSPVGTPDPGAFWRVVSEHRVKVLFTAPTAIRAIKREDPTGEFVRKYDLSPLKYLFIVGERLDPDTYYWVSELLKKPVIDHWWQTETGWPAASNCMGLEPFPIKAGSATKPVPGYQVQILDKEGEVLPPETEGMVGIKLPLPPGSLLTLWEDDSRFKESYLNIFPGYYYTGDVGYFDGDGYLYIMGRVDDAIRVAGHRLSTGTMEEVIANHLDVAECAVVGSAVGFPIAFVVLKSDVTRDPSPIVKELLKMVRDQIGTFASLKQVVIVKRLPKTKSGKILRGTLRRIVDGKKYTIPSTIDDPTILKEIEKAIKRTQWDENIQ